MNTDVYDLLGIGFGPSNLSLVIALKEMSVESRFLRFKMRFFERQRNYNWHCNLLLPGSTMQISFLKDLVTQRNPQSYYTFLNFLKKTNRLEDFINVREFHPSREEFSEYLKWVSHNLRDQVDYGCQVTGIDPVPDDSGKIRELKLTVESPEGERAYTCKNLVIAIGGRPKYIGKGVDKSPRVAHSNEYLSKLSAQFKNPNAKYRFAVIGAGQSAIEMCMHLYDHFPNAVIYIYFSGFAFKSCDSGPFLNEMFMSKNTDAVYFGNPYTRSKLLDSVTNYGVVDAEDLKRLYSTIYLDKFFCRQRILIQNFTVVKNITDNSDEVCVQIENKSSGLSSAENFDGVFLGTGFERNLNLPMLDGIVDYLKKDGANYLVNRNYSLETCSEMECKIFVQGATESVHGIPNSLLSVLAYRSEEIASAVLEKTLQQEVEEISYAKPEFA